MAAIDDIEIPTLLLDEQGGDPTTPASGFWRLYAKSGGLFIKDDAGAVVGPLVSASGSLGAWTDYTPAFTAVTSNPVLGSSTIQGRYKELDAYTIVVQVVLSITTGGAWNAGSGSWQFGLPSGVTSAARAQVGSVHVLDSGTGHYAGTAYVGPSATIIAESYIADATAPRVLSHNAPITWATGDRVDISILLEQV